MARNGSGTHSVPNSFSAGSTIESSAMNANFTDIASEITNSLPRDGQAAMTGQMKAASGSVAAPSITFGADTDTGFYRKSANTIGVVAGGTEVGTIGSGGFSSFPSGTKMLFVQTAAPTGWTKDTTHNDKALRVVSGSAATGGSTAFTTVFTGRSLASGNLPPHTHTVSGATAGHGTVLTGATTASYITSVSGSGISTTSGTAVASITSGGSADSFSVTSGNGPGSSTSVDFAVQYVDVTICTKD
jgi:hypothetical protein